jgi:hypothetical protein
MSPQCRWTLRPLLAAGAAALSLASACYAEPQEIPKPPIEAGEHWTYQRMDYETGKVIGNYTLEVTFVGKSAIQGVNISRSERENDVTYTAEWNSVSTPTRVFLPERHWLDFPLRVGKKWNGDFEMLRPRDGSFHVKFEREVTVVGWEDVTVPAGTFHALKIVSEGPAQRVDRSLSFRSRNTLWYAPEVKRWVKQISENSRDDFRTHNLWEGEELVGYKLR